MHRGRWPLAVAFAVMSLAGCGGGDSIDSGPGGPDSGPWADSSNPGTDSGAATDAAPGMDSGTQVDSGNPGTDSAAAIDAAPGTDSGSGGTDAGGSDAGDTTAPAVDSMAPADGATAVAPMANISVTFSEAMDPSTITTNTADTACSGALQVSSDGFVTCVQMTGPPTTSDGTTFSIVPVAALTSATQYLVRVTTAAADMAGNPLATTFETAAGFAVRFFHTISIDGVNDFTAADEGFSSSTVSAGLYVAHDDTNVYVALEHSDILVGGTGNKFVYFLFSTDPTLATGNDLSSDGKAKFGAPGTERLSYHWKEQIDGGSWTEFRIGDGTDWTTDWGFANKVVFKAAGYLEASIALTEFGGSVPSTLIVTAYTIDYDGAAGDGWLYNMLPGAADGPGIPARDVVTYIRLDLPTSLVPNDPSNPQAF